MSKIFWLTLCLSFLVVSSTGANLQTNNTVPDVVVHTDGSGNYATIMGALSSAPDRSDQKFVIYIKNGEYREYVDINDNKWNITMIGDGAGITVISGNRSAADGWCTENSATFTVRGPGFIAQYMTFENTAGPQMHQAVAFHSYSDLSALFRCAIRGYQDTLYAHSHRQFYKECTITGTIDFIFGDATAVFQNCQIIARKGLANQKNTITAQHCSWPGYCSGFSFQFSNISTEPDLGSTLTYLGRPWGMYSRTVFMQCYMSSAISPEGWLEWDGVFAVDTLFYGEYMNNGPGAGLGNRVKWPGFHAINDSAEAEQFTTAIFISGNSWLPSTNVPYSPGLVDTTPVLVYTGSAMGVFGGFVWLAAMQVLISGFWYCD